MTQADPTNEMGWFSLGSAYKDAGRPDEAAAALRKTLELNEGMSRGYQLLGQVLILLGQKDEATKVLTKGYVVAAGRGDVMPQRAMGSLLEKIGQPVPEVKTADAAAAAPIGENAIVCRRSGQAGTRMSDQPMRGPMGKFIMDHYSLETWREWIKTGTKVINELRLDFSNAEHQRMYDLHMIQWLGVTEDEVDEYAKSVSEKK